MWLELMKVKSMRDNPNQIAPALPGQLAFPANPAQGAASVNVQVEVEDDTDPAPFDPAGLAAEKKMGAALNLVSYYTSDAEAEKIDRWIVPGQTVFIFVEAPTSKIRVFSLRGPRPPQVS